VATGRRQHCWLGLQVRAVQPHACILGSSHRLLHSNSVRLQAAAGNTRRHVGGTGFDQLVQGCKKPLFFPPQLR
jgi:hypothetical protein